MPTFTVPDNFTVTDEEFLESKRTQEAVYRDEGRRQAGYASYVDALGHARWDTDYVTLRMAGYSHAAALQEMRVRIRESWNPPLPAVEPHVPPPSRPSGPPPQPGQPGQSPLDVIRAAIRQADREMPGRAHRNLKVDCWELLRRAAEIAGPEWAFIGKTADMDGGGKFTPPGFRTFSVQLPREDGQLQTVTIVGLSMDALWHLPTGTQFKVIVNSTDGEIADGGQGRPASLDSYPIDEFKDGTRQYRWHNPPVGQSYVNGQ